MFKEGMRVRRRDGSQQGKITRVSEAYLYIVWDGSLVITKMCVASAKSLLAPLAEPVKQNYLPADPTAVALMWGKDGLAVGEKVRAKSNLSWNCHAVFVGMIGYIQQVSPPHAEILWEGTSDSWFCHRDHFDVLPPDEPVFECPTQTETLSKPEVLHSCDPNEAHQPEDDEDEPAAEEFYISRVQLMEALFETDPELSEHVARMAEEGTAALLTDLDKDKARERALEIARADADVGKDSPEHRAYRRALPRAKDLFDLLVRKRY
jgi:hypothetical protein